MVATPQLRADRATLSPPRKRGAGEVVFDAVLARADVPMVYEWGTEVATVEALSDPAYLDGLKGTSLTTMKTAPHRNGQRPHHSPTDGGVVGSVLSARWDAEDKLVAVEIVVHDGPTLAAIDAGELRDLSETYAPTVRTRADGVVEQTARSTNTIAIVPRGRMPGAFIRADGAEMTEEQIKAAIKAAIAEQMRADADHAAALQAANDRADAAEGALKALRESIGLQADSADVSGALATKVAEGIAADVKLTARASELGITLPEGSTPATRLKDIAVACGGDKLRADADPAYCEGVIAVAQPTAAKRHATGDGVPTTVTRLA